MSSLLRDGASKLRSLFQPEPEREICRVLRVHNPPFLRAGGVMTPAPGRCGQRLNLLADIRAAMSEMAALHAEEIESLLRDDFEAMNEIAKKLTAARQHKSSMIERYHEHVRSHGC